VNEATWIEWWSILLAMALQIGYFDILAGFFDISKNFKILVCYFRYALVCKQCQSHNGMALKEEFEYTGKQFFSVFQTQ